MMEADQNGDGKLDFDEFKAMVANTDIAKQMVRSLPSSCSPLLSKIAANPVSFAFHRHSKVSCSSRLFRSSRDTS